MKMQRVAIVGGGWAGMAAAVYATQAGHAVTLFEAAHQWGGRARSVPLPWPNASDDGSDDSNDSNRDNGNGSGNNSQAGERTLDFDNGQHILIGAYSASFALMRLVGVNPEHAFLRLPLALRFADGTGLALPDWPAPFDAGWGIATAKGWRWADKLALLRTAGRWRLQGFVCAPELSVAQLCAGLSQRLMAEFIDPLCVSALNTPAHEASGQVFLRVLRDSLMGPRVGALGASNLMLPRYAMGALWCDAAALWLQARGASLRLGHAVKTLAASESESASAASNPAACRWCVDDEPFDTVILATSAAPGARLVQTLSESLRNRANNASALAQPQSPGSVNTTAAATTAHWAQLAGALRFEAISTVYAMATAHQKKLASGYHLHHPMLALRATAEHPAQFVFERDQLHRQAEPSRALAFVVSASRLDRDTLARAVTAQAQAELGLQVRPMHVLIDKRATFCCTPGLQRPPMTIAPGLLACGDHVAGPYPATLEGAVRSAHEAVQALAQTGIELGGTARACP